MQISDLNDLELSNIGAWPTPAKAVLVLVLCAAIGWAWYHFVTQDQLERLAQVEQEELELRETFEDKQDKAANLEDYQQQLTEMEESFGAMVRQLPDRTEVAGLLVDVSQTGLAAGLEFELFEPAGEQTKDFYAELPIRMRVNGRYHEFGRFISGLAALPRIVTIHNVQIAAPSQRGDAPGTDVSLTMEATVKTYRYLEEGAVQ
ncbi:type IV pilus inner membrane component PilO [Thiohalocapsa halophila]